MAIKIAKLVGTGDSAALIEISPSSNGGFQVEVSAKEVITITSIDRSVNHAIRGASSLRLIATLIPNIAQSDFHTLKTRARIAAMLRRIVTGKVWDFLVSDSQLCPGCNEESLLVSYVPTADRWRVECGLCEYTGEIYKTIDAVISSDRIIP